jgi:hypothetical protein
MSRIYGKRVRPTEAQRASREQTIAVLDVPTHAPVLVRSGAVELRAVEGEQAVGVQDNLLRGVPCRMGHAYPIGWGDYEVVFPGAFTEEAIPRFMREGTILRDHEWDELPIAYPTLLEERGRDLYAEGVYHPDAAAQAARGVAVDRLSHNLMVGLSIGFFLESDSYKWFGDGQALLDFAQANGFPMNLFDKKQIKSVDGWICGVVRIRQLVEFSQCSVLQANDMAEMMEVNSAGVDSTTTQDAEAQRLRDEAEAAKLRAEAVELRESRARNLRARTLETLAHSQSNLQKENL